MGLALAAPAHDVRVDVRPRSPFRLPARGSLDGVLRCRGGVLHRLMHVDGEPAVVRAAQPSRDRVVLGAQSARRDVAEEAIGRMRFALGVDDDLRPFHARFRFDPLIGPAVRLAPELRITRHPQPFEALAWAVCEQLIEAVRAGAIERRIVGALGRRCPRTGLRDVPDARALAAQAPARLQAFDLSAGRALALVRCAREVATGRADLHGADHERAWRRLRRIPGIGSWTLAMLALHGQGRYDAIPAGDLGYLKLLGRLRSGGDPHARGTEEEVLECFAPYAPWSGLAGAYALRGPIPLTPPSAAPRRAGTRRSATAASAAA